MSQAVWLLKQSLALDRRLLNFYAWPYGTRVSFILKKYRVIGRHFVRPFNLGESYVQWRGETIYYDSRFGLAGYQRILTSQVNLFQIAGLAGFRTVIDCGANVGYFSKMITQIAPGALVYAIEPVPAIFECLRKNTATSPNVKVFETALSDSVGYLRMAFDPQESAISHVSDSGGVEVVSTTLDQFVASNGIESIDLLKIDTESFEDRVLRGAEATLARTKNLLIEVTMEGNHNYTMSSLMCLLQGDGYDFQLVAFRNLADSGEGRIPVMDCLMVNEAKVNTNPLGT